jgi:hypothetical protein
LIDLAKTREVKIRMSSRKTLKNAYGAFLRRRVEAWDKLELAIVLAGELC